MAVKRKKKIQQAGIKVKRGCRNDPAVHELILPESDKQPLQELGVRVQSNGTRVKQWAEHAFNRLDSQAEDAHRR